WHHHTLDQIARRLASGASHIVVRSYTTFWYFKYVSLYVVFGCILALSNRRAFAGAVAAHAPLAAFLALSGGVYLVAIACYAPTSGAGTARFLLADVAALLFTLSVFFVREPFASTRWTLGTTVLTPAHFHLAVAATIALDLGFTLWPRLMSTYGGF